MRRIWIAVVVAVLAVAPVAGAGEEDTTKPKSKITHPRTAIFTYDQEALKKIRGWASDGGGSGYKDTQMALRMRLKDGTCKWYAGKWFVKRACGNKLWKVADDEDMGGRWNWWYWVNPLPVSTGKTKVAVYTAFSRARDNGGNVEDDFDLYRNKERFDIKP